MKILRLNLCNLASIAGEHSIDFESEPLSNAGLIAITGKTGAGKSTLLDAMCLALYDQIPRLNGAVGSLKDPSGQGISIKDSKNILRRGTTIGFAELEFIALDQKRYIARWDIRRARNKMDGNLKVDRAIRCVEDQRILTQKISECTPTIEKLIGLSFEQFTRAVLLAQSEVGAFLKAKDQDRADLLEYLTNSHIFSVVSQKAFEKTKEIRQQKEQLQSLIGHIELLSEEQVVELKQQHEQSRLQLRSQQQAEKLLQNDLRWHQQQHVLHTEIQAKKEFYWVQVDANEKMAAQKALLEKLDQFQSIRDAFVQQKNIQQQRAELKQQQTIFLTQFHSLEQQYLQHQTQLNALIVALKTQQQQHVEFKPTLEQTLDLDNQIDVLIKQYKNTQTQIEQILTNQIQPFTQQQLILQQQLQLIQQDHQKLEQQLLTSQNLAVFDREPQATIERLQQFEKLQQQIQQKNEAYTQYSSSELREQLAERYLQQRVLIQQYGDLNKMEQQQSTLRQQQSSAQDCLHHVEQTLFLLQQIFKDQQEQQQIQIHHAQLLVQSKTLQHDIEQAQQQYLSAQKAREQVQELFAQQRLLQTQSVQDLRAQLQPDTACMVCGSNEHPFVSHQELLHSALQHVQDIQLQQGQNEETQAHEALQKLILDQSRLHTLIEQKTLRLEELVQNQQLQFSQIQHIIQQQHLEVNTDLKPDALQSQLNQLKHEIKQQQIKYAEQQQQLQQYIQQSRTLNQDIQTLEMVEQQFNQLEQCVEPLLKQFDQPLLIQWQTNPRLSQQLIQDIQTRSHTIQQLEKMGLQQQNLQQQLAYTQKELQFYQLQIQQFEQQNHATSAEGTVLRQRIKNLIAPFNDQGFDVGKKWLLALDNEKIELEQNIEQQRQHFSQSDQQFQQAQLKQQEYQTTATQFEQRLEQLEAHIASWQKQHAHFSLDDIQHCLSLSSQEAQNIRFYVERQQQAVLSAKSVLDTLEHQFEKHQAQQPELSFEDVQQQLHTFEAELLHLQEQFNELDAKQRLQHQALAQSAKYQQHIEKIVAEEYRWGRISELIGSKEGTKFQKMAQEYHLDILVEYANQQLQPLAARYQLQRIPDSLGLAIIDHDMNGEIRPVLSLSGGETFLVSLALALAIANMASGSMKLESLFIDEGFGTLDPASLHLVMNALDQLQSQGRKVVLISHIQDMHERIPVQIQVNSIGAGASRIHITG